MSGVFFERFSFISL